MEGTIPLDAIPVMVPGADFSKLKLGAQEGFLLSRIDGVTNVKGVCAVSNLPESQALELLTSLAQDGVVQFKDKSGAQLAIAAPDTSGIDPNIRRRIQAIHRAEEQQNPYDILGVPRDAKLKDIKLAYYALTEQLHPDNFYGQEVGDWEAKIDHAFTAVTKAYEDLGDPEIRAKIDNRLKLLLGPDKVESKSAAAKPSGPAKPKVTREKSAIFQAVKEKIHKARELADAAELQLHDGDFMGAYSSYKLASTYDPYNDEYKRNLGMLEGKVSKIRAGNDFKQALRKIDMHETDDALALLRKVVDADRNHAAARYELARLLMPKMKRGGQPIQQEALEMAESAAILESEVDYLLLAAQINRALGNDEAAKEFYKDVVKIDKKNDVAKKALKEL